jgi:hypothetical protein
LDPLPHIKQDPRNVDAGIWVFAAVVGVALLAVAMLLYTLNHLTAAVVVGLLGAIGVSITGLPFGWVRGRLSRARAEKKSRVNGPGGGGAT